MSDVNYRVHEQLSVVADLKVREAMDAIVAVVQIEVATAHGEGEKCARAEEAAKYKAVVEAAKAFTSGGQAELCGACAYGRFNIRKLSTVLAALEGK